MVDGIEMSHGLSMVHYFLRVIQQKHAEENQTTVDAQRIQAQPKPCSWWQEHTSLNLK